MKIIREPSLLYEIWETRTVDFDNMMKIVVDISREILSIDAEMHADLEQLMLSEGSDQDSLWGANVLIGTEKEVRLEYTSFINIRPAMGNRSMEILDGNLRDKMKHIVDNLLI